MGEERDEHEEREDYGGNFHDEKKIKRKKKKERNSISMFQIFHLTSIKNDIILI